MKKTILAAGALALLGSTAAHAADVVNYQEDVVVAETVSAPAAVNWSGFYAGGTIGGSWGEADTKLKQDKTTFVKKKVKPETFMGGLYAGYNFELANNIVLGIETDFLWNDKGDAANSDYKANGGLGFNYKASVKQKWNGATRVRAGYALGQEKRFLPYVAAGVSYAEFDTNVKTTSTTGTNKGKSSSYKDNGNQTGWNVGAGIDYVPPIMNDHLVLRAEYRYTDFGDETYNRGKLGNAGLAGKEAKQKVDYTQNDFRVGVAYKF